MHLNSLCPRQTVPDRHPTAYMSIRYCTPCIYVFIPTTSDRRHQIKRSPILWLTIVSLDATVWGWTPLDRYLQLATRLSVPFQWSVVKTLVSAIALLSGVLEIVGQFICFLLPHCIRVFVRLLVSLFESRSWGHEFDFLLVMTRSFFSCALENTLASVLVIEVCTKKKCRMPKLFVII